MMEKKNIVLSLVLTMLLAVSISLSYWDQRPGPQFDSKKFAIDDIDRINRIVMTRDQEVLEFQAFTQGFLINNTYTMDQNLLGVLAAVLQQVRVQRPVSEKQQTDLWEEIKSDGTHVQVFEGERLLKSFWAGGDDAKDKSYFATEQGEVYLVGLPGYTNYLSGLFEMGLSGWRSKNIFQSTWRSILSFSLEDFEQPENNFRIEYSDPFFEVPGIEKIDSNRVIGYLENLAGLRAVSPVDTTFQGPPWLRLTTVDINEKRNTELTLFQADSLLLGKANDQYYWFRKEQLVPFIRNSQYFSRAD